MGKDYDLEPYDLGPLLTLLTDNFIRDWTQNFHDKNNAMTTASQWALYEFIDDLKIKLGLNNRNLRAMKKKILEIEKRLRARCKK